jgi:hypothetical protein
LDKSMFHVSNTRTGDGQRQATLCHDKSAKEPRV